MRALGSQAAHGEIGEAPTRPDGAPHGEMPVRLALSAAAVELERALGCAQALQASLSPLLRRGQDAVFAGQALDDLTQHIEGLGGFLAALARDCPQHWRFDAVRASEPLKLHAQKMRLIGEDIAPEIPASAAGELELW